MRYLAPRAIVLGLAIMLSTAWTPHYILQKQQDPELEKKIEMIFLYQPCLPENKYDAKAEIEKLGFELEARAILINMLTKYRYAKLGTPQYLYLDGATHIVGKLEAKEAATPLSQILFDRRVHENARAR